jgi:hypothetical protein
MTTFADMVYMLGGVPAMAGIPFGPKSKYYFVDPSSSEASDSNAGTSLQSPLASLEAAEDKCVADQHDTVFFIASDTADNPTASITWDKDFTHLIGIGSYLPGLGQRCRVVLEAAIAATPVITFSGNGCIVKNMQFNQEKATGAASGVAIVTGQRCLFENVFFMTPVSQTAASYSLKVSGGENHFINCTIGQQTRLRTAATRALWLYKGDGDNQRNYFEHCRFLSWSSVTTHVLAYTDVDIDNEGFSVFFDKCSFLNYYGSGEAGGKLAVAIDDNCAVFHQIYMMGQENCIAGCTAVADPLTYVMKAEASGTASGLLMALVNES